MLALPSGTSVIMAGLSGAGDRMPALAHDASFPGSCLSKRLTRRPARANSNAIEAPIKPPPAIATSNVFMILILSQWENLEVSRGVSLRIRSRQIVTTTTQGLPTESEPSLQDFLRVPSRLRGLPHVLPS